MADESSACLVEEMISAFVAGSISTADFATVEGHLANCAVCRGLVADAAEGAASSTGPQRARQIAADEDGGVHLVSTEPWAAEPPMTGQVLADKYVVERLIGSGGMGDVYAAVHIELGHRVAIKVLRQADPTASARLLREARTCARLVNEHIPRVFDVDRLPNGSPYIVMEFLAGEDLARRAARDRVTPSEAAAYVMQACSALRDAHAAGIVHRDLKPGNLFLTSRQGDSPLVKVLDFGISKRNDPDEAPQSLTSTGVILGSPIYMSPEQVRAEKDVDTRTDIWSLGVILYELITARPPFRATTLSALSVAIATETPERPASLRSDLPPGLEPVVLRCLEKDRARRFDSVDALARALAPFAGPPPTKTASGNVASGRAGWRPLVRWTSIVGALALALAGGAWWARAHRRAPTPSVSASTPRRSVAIVGLRNTSGRPAEMWLGTALADLLRTELGSGDQLRIISPERVATMKRDLQLGESDSLERATLDRIQQMVGADIALVGSYWRLEESDDLRIDATLQDTRSGETLAAVAEHGPGSELFAIVGRAGERLRKKLGADALSSTELADVKRTLPADAAAREWYAQGRAAFDRMDHLTAIEALGKVAEREPNFAPGHGLLSEAWGDLHYDQRAAEEAEKALALARDLPRKEQLLLEARACLRTNQAAKAIEISRSLFTVFPDELDFGLDLARAEMQASQADAALATIARLHTLPVGDDPRVDLAEANAARDVSDYTRSVAAARRAFQKAEARRMQSLEAETRLLEGQALAFLGQTGAATRAFIDARERFTELHDQGGVARALDKLGEHEAITGTGDGEEATKDLTEASRLYELVGDRENGARVHISLGNASLESGNATGGAREFRRALEALAAIGSQSDGTITAQGNLAVALVPLGELAEADRLFASAIDLAKKIAEPRLEGGFQGGRAFVLLMLGRLEEARAAADTALQIALRLNDAANIVAAQTAIAQVLRFAGDGAASRRLLTQAIEGMQKIQGPGLSELMIYGMALDLDDGQPSRLVADASEWSQMFGHSQLLADQARVHSQVALALLAQNQLAEATREAHEAMRLTKDSDDVPARSDATLASAKVRAAAGDLAGAAGALQAMLATSKHIGRPKEYEARLALAEVERASHAAAWREHLRETADSATREHFLLYANRANALLQSKNN